MLTLLLLALRRGEHHVVGCPRDLPLQGSTALRQGHHKKSGVNNDAAVGSECPEACPAVGQGFDESESESDSSLSQRCTSAEPPQEAPVIGESVAEGKAGVLYLCCLMACLNLRSPSEVALRWNCHMVF